MSPLRQFGQVLITGISCPRSEEFRDWLRFKGMVQRPHSVEWGWCKSLPTVRDIGGAWTRQISHSKFNRWCSLRLCWPFTMCGVPPHKRAKRLRVPQKSAKRAKGVPRTHVLGHFPSTLNLENEVLTDPLKAPQGLHRLRKNVEQRAKTVPSAAKAGHNYNHLWTA